MTEIPIRVGVIGLKPGEGWAAAAHVPALRALPGYELVGVANSSRASAQAAATALAIPRAYDTVAALIADAAIDLVAVTVKVPHHRELVDAAMAGGKMVYCEWPLGKTLAEAEAMASAAEVAGLRTVIGLQARAAPAVRYVRDLVAQGYVGQVLSTTLVGSGGGWGASDTPRDAYTNDRANGANLLTIPFGHAVDMLSFCLGDFRDVVATFALRRPTYRLAGTDEPQVRTVDDQIVVAGTLAGGTVAAIHYRGGSSRGTNFRWEINGTAGDLEITAASGHPQMAALTLRGASGNDTGLAALPVPEIYHTVADSLTGRPVNVAEAYGQFARGSAAAFPPPDFAAAVRTHRLLDAIAASAASGCRVALPA